MLSDPSRLLRPVPATDAAPWAIHVTAEFVGLGATHYHADLFCDDDWMCQISLTRPVASRAEAEGILAERCRHWIAGFHKNGRPGYTDFRDVGGRRPVVTARLTEVQRSCRHSGRQYVHHLARRNALLRRGSARCRTRAMI